MKSTGLCIAVMLAASAAQAQDVPTTPLQPWRESSFSGDLGFFYRTSMVGTTTSTFGVLSPGLYGTFLVSPLGDSEFLVVDAAWRAIGYFGSSSAFRAGNPYIGVRVGTHGRTSDSQWRFRGGGGITLPLTNAYDDFSLTGSSLGAFIVMPAMFGAYDAWLESALNMALVFRGDAEYRAKYFAFGGDAAFGALFPVTYMGSTGSTLLDGQVSLWGAGRPIPQLLIGVRFQAVALTTTGMTGAGRSNTEGYTALIPFVRGELDESFVELRLLMNLDDPYGFAFDGGPTSFHVWALQLAAGTSW